MKPKITSDSNPKLVLAFSLAAVAATFLAGCNTVDGAGEDLQAASEAVEEEIED